MRTRPDSASLPPSEDDTPTASEVGEAVKATAYRALDLMDDALALANWGLANPAQYFELVAKLLPTNINAPTWATVSAVPWPRHEP